MKRVMVALATLLMGCVVSAHAGQRCMPQFSATALTGQSVNAADLLGQRTILMVTPSPAAGEETREWAHALRGSFDVDAIRVRDVIAVDLPFFISEQLAASLARDQIPSRYYAQTWLTGGSKLEAGLGIPTDSKHAFVFVLDSHGCVAMRMKGAPTTARVRKIKAVLRLLR